jgi:hypothetical protein
LLSIEVDFAQSDDEDSFIARRLEQLLSWSVESRDEGLREGSLKLFAPAAEKEDATFQD